jgi:glycine/D-amino acid oxidase-like deaminating enzyme
MELVAGSPYWLIKSGLPYQYPKLLKNQKCGVAIIGGGISGALTAYYCTQAGFDCILVEGRSIALGSTCASTSLLQYELDLPLHKLKKLVGEYNAVRSYQLCGDAIDKLISLMARIGFSDYSKKQSLYFSRHQNEKKAMEKEWLARRQAGFDAEFICAEDLIKTYGLEASCGILSEKGATTNAYLFAHEILQYCMHRGTRVFDRTDIKNILPSKKKLVLETGEGYSIKCDYVINATGYEVAKFIRKKIVNLDCTYAIISQPGSEKKVTRNDKVMMWNTDHPYLYLCWVNGDRIIVGGRDEPFVSVKTMHTYLDKKAALLEKDFVKCFPASSIRKEFAWSGVFGKTKDSLPYIGRDPKLPRIFYALGFGGNGITFSLVAAEIVSDLLLGKKNRDADIFSFSR